MANRLEIVAYINKPFDENALLSFDRERGRRARLGFSTNQARTFGLRGARASEAVDKGGRGGKAPAFFFGR